MAYSFNGTNQYISAASSPLDGTMPITISIWGKRNTTGADYLLWGFGNSGNNHVVNLYWTSGNSMAAFQRGATTFGQSVTGADTVTTFQHFAGVFQSNSSRTAYKSGSAATPNTTNTGASSLNALSIAATVAATAYLPGSACEAAAWSVALTEAEITSLSNGFKPSRIRPQSLVFYAPLIRDLNDIRDSRALTNNNSATVADHPRVY